MCVRFSGCAVYNGIEEENFELLMGRMLALANDYGAHCELSMSDEMAVAVACLTPGGIRVAASDVFPIFKLALDANGLERLLLTLKEGGADVRDELAAQRRSKRKLLHELIVCENEHILMNRWAAAREGGIRTKIVYCMSDKLIRVLRSMTQKDVRLVASSGYVLAQHNTRPGFFYQACNCPHVVAKQIDNLAIASSISRE